MFKIQNTVKFFPIKTQMQSLFLEFEMRDAPNGYSYFVQCTFHFLFITFFSYFNFHEKGFQVSHTVIVCGFSSY